MEKDQTTRDDELEQCLFSPVCTLCVHLTDITERKCEAFPDGIPREIWLGENNHTEAFVGDNGILFERGRSPANKPSGKQIRLGGRIQEGGGVHRWQE